MRQAPIIIGGTGGSGTRAVEDVFERAGFFMGARLNDARDALDFDDYFANTIPVVLRKTKKTDFTLSDLEPEFVSERLQRLRRLVRRFREACPGDAAGWGLKHPRSIYLVPFLQRLFPNMAFVHVVRDGRDMALSRNQNQLVSFYRPLTGRSLPEDRPLASVQMWQRVNLERTRWAVQNMGKRYRIVRFEDICERPEETISALLAALGIEAKNIAALCQGIEKPDSIGRYATLPPARQRALAEAGMAGLMFYGYLPL